MDQQQAKTIPIKQLDIQLDSDFFFRNLIRSLSGVLEDVVGLEDASGFISIVGQNIGAEINQLYKSELSTSKLDRIQVGEVLVDLKARIGGDFSLEEQSDEKLVFANNACPFGESVLDRPSMCMMTSNVFGSICAENLGYAKVTILEAIADRCSGCKVVVYLAQTEESGAAEGREYFGT